MALGPGTHLGPYEIVVPLGAGGMGEVYRARDTRLDRDVALKILPDAFANDADRVARFQREAKTLASINHPNIAIVHGLERAEDLHALVMELVEGEDLSDRIARGAIPPDEALPMARQIAEALEAAHEQGIVHRDLKPANIKLRSDGTVKVLDFGLAKAFDFGGDSSASAMQSPTLSIHATQAGVILGTAAYMSPEQARGRPVDRRADVWAFGAVLYEMLTGRRAFDGETVSDTLAFVITKEPDWTALPSTVSRGLRDLLHRCLTKDPRMRLRDIGEARIAIDALGSANVEPSVLRIPRAEPRWRRILPWAVAAVATAAAVSAWLIAPPPSRGLVRRFAVPIPASLPIVFGQGGTGLAISPNGSTVVYASASGLVRRRLDTQDVAPLRGAEGGGAPFFSPDGAWVAYFTGQELRKVPVDGGMSVRLCEASFGRGSWADDNTIAFTTGGRLFLVPAAGGIPKVLSAGDEGQLTQPHWLPDAQALLIRRTQRAGLGGGEIEVIDRRTGASTTIVTGGSPQLAPSGDLIFGRAGAIWAVGFDAGRRAARGEPVPVIESVAGGGPNELLAFAMARDGTAAYVGGVADVSLVWLDRAGKAESALAASGRFQSPRLSPDGRRVVVSVAEGSNLDLWAYEFERGTRLRLTTNGRSRRTVWSPDGSKVAFYSTPDAGGDQDLFTVPSTGGEMSRLLERPRAQFPSSWSPDGRFLLFEEFEATASRRDAWLLPLGEAPKPLVVTSFNERGAVFSPDGDWVAFVSDESGRPEVYVQQFPGSAPKMTVSLNGGIQPVWSRDGRELFYREGDWLMTAGVQRPFRILSARRLFEMSGSSHNSDPNFADYDVAADGRFIAVRRDRPENTEIQVVLNWTEEVRRALAR